MDKWIIEKRKADGTLDFSDPQPEQFFGVAAITGIGVDAMAKVIYRHVDNDPRVDGVNVIANVTLDGRDIANWPKRIDPGFVAREKYW
jgi:hypothetical protein